MKTKYKMLAITAFVVLLGLSLCGCTSSNSTEDNTPVRTVNINGNITIDEKTPAPGWVVVAVYGNCLKPFKIDNGSFNVTIPENTACTLQISDEKCNTIQSYDLSATSHDQKIVISNSEVQYV
jgi:hypothetical protein